MAHCCVKGCVNKRFPGCGINFYRIPENPELREKWRKTLSLDGKLSQNSLVCSRHFKSNDYVPTTSCDQGVGSLEQSVIPSVEEKGSNQPDPEEESIDDPLDIREVTANDLSTEIKTNKGNLLRSRLEGNITNKIMLVTPISNVNKIEDVITIKPNVINGRTQSNSRVIKTVGSSVMSQVSGSINKMLTQKQPNRIIVVKPIDENERIEEIISTKIVSDSDDSDDISTLNDNSDSDISSDGEKSMVTPKYAIEATTERTLKRRYVQGSPIDMYCSKVPRLDTTVTNVTVKTSETPSKHDVSTQTGPFTTIKEENLRYKIKLLNQKMNRQVKALNKMKTILKLIENKCTSYAEVKQVLTLKLKHLPENLDCDGVIIVP